MDGITGQEALKHQNLDLKLPILLWKWKRPQAIRVKRENEEKWAETEPILRMLANMKSDTHKLMQSHLQK